MVVGVDDVNRGTVTLLEDNDELEKKAGFLVEFGSKDMTEDKLPEGGRQDLATEDE